MKQTPSLPIENRPLVLLIGEPTGLCLTLTELFIGNFCRVRILSTEKEEWIKLTNHIEDKRGFEIIPFSKNANLKDVDYGLFVYQGHFLNYSKGKELLDYFVSNVKKFSSNSLIVSPFQKESEDDLKMDKDIKDVFKKGKEYLGVQLLGETLGPRITLSSQRTVSRAVKEALDGKKVSLPPENMPFYPVLVSAAARSILRSLLSFGGVGQIGTILSYPLLFGKFAEILAKFHPSIKFSFASENNIVYENEVKLDFLPLDVRKAILETLEWYRSHPAEGAEPIKKVSKRKIDKGKIFRELNLDIRKFSPPKPALTQKPWAKWGLSLAGVLVVLLVVPYSLIALSSAMLLLAKNNVYSYNLSRANRYSQASSIAASVSYGELAVLSKIPFVGNIFYSGVELASLDKEAAGLISEGYQLSALAADLASHVFGNEAYDVSQYSREISLELDDFYNKTAFLQGEIDSSKGLAKVLLTKAINPDDLRSLRDKIYSTKQVADELPGLLGQQKEKKYLLLFQNNMELRPTGGFIGSYAIVTFDKGKLSSLNVDDVYSADGQLKGHVEPPSPIKNYLGEANWFLRDSNWDPDFPTSAERAEWFLDKEVETSVDGVVGIDLEVAKSLVDEVGPIDLSDFNQTITSKNLYEVTQYEVENDFFPGSRKKSNFLTALSRELLQKITKVNSKEYINVARAVYESLNTKHIQLYFHDQAAQRAISNLAWDGAFYQPTCFDNCYAQYLGIVEANVGVNKANYFVERRASLKVNVTASKTENELTIDLKNNGNPSLGLSARYKDYLRVDVPQSADFSSIDILGANTRDTRGPEINEVRGIKEAGVLVEVAAGQEKQIVFKWTNDHDLSFSQNGEYRFLWRKQAGTVSDPISFEITFPQGVNISSQTPLALTQGNTYRYNTNLSRDFSSRIFW